MTFRSDRTEAGYRAACALLSIVFLAGSLVWALTTPAFHGPDEALHYNSVNRILSGEGWPEPYDAEVKGSTWQAVGESTGSHVLFAPEEVRSLPKPPPDERSSMAGPTDLEDQTRDQMVQHPPGYYGLAAGILQLAGGTSLSWDTALVTLRILSAVLTAAAVPFMVGLGRRLTDSRRAGLIGATGVLAIPFFTTMGGYATNDSLLLLMTSATLYTAVRAIDAPRVVPWLLATGVGLGLALLTKGLALLLIPVIGVLGVMALWRRDGSVVRRALLLGLPQAVAFVIGGWWWLRNLLVLGSLQPSQCGLPTRCAEVAPSDPPPPDFWVFTTNFLERFSRLFWGRGGLEEIAYPVVLTTTASIAVVVIVLAALALGRRRAVVAVLLLLPTLVVVTIFRNAYGIYLDVGAPNRGVQGRYVFSGIAVLSACIAAVWARIRPDFRLGRAADVAVTAAAAIVAVGGWVWVFERLWVRPYDGWRQGLLAASDSVGASPWFTAGAFATFVVGLVAFAVSLLFQARPRQLAPVDEGPR
ncbi:phospholipid carrier-dependent glycosyltransferase [Aeromicrobium sp. CTD01-1L150]|uniref:phospholipid carrier-dependent glycosyltransferase n=1 Tax=Aeromicrobium sp. CTD01-1L150 TaxID=3341830 RepID=UPI0035BF4C20